MTINILSYLTRAAESHPDKIAFADTKMSLTFSQLDILARKIGSKLLSDGYNKKPIAVQMDKSPNTVAACFGVIYAGCYYAVIDKEMPPSRIELIYNSFQPAAVITEESFKNYAEADIDEALLTSAYEKAIDLDPLYVVFTSGSTGIPKGVTACHRSVIDYIENLTEVLQADETTIFGNQAPLYVDACLKEVYTTIKTGATTYLIPKECFMFPVKMSEFLKQHKINTICWVSSALSMIASMKTFDNPELIPDYLRTVAFGSELFPVKNLNIWRKALPHARFINLYGPTEATGMSSYYIVNRDFSEDERIPIGKPFRNTEILLMSDDYCGTNTRAEVLGEICIRGSCLSLGYYNDFEKTAESFTQNPNVTAYPDLIYKTGDLGSYNQYGELVYHSRKDYQIKHMGYRIELPEIEAAACQCKGVALASCLYDPSKSIISIYYTGSISTSELIKHLKQKLPRYMLPKVIQLEKMPMTANGKINRNELNQWKN